MSMVHPCRHQGPRRCRPPSHGAGLLEALVVLAVSLILGAQAIPAMQLQLSLWRLEAASADVGRLLRLARQQMAARRAPLRLDVGIDEGSGACLLLHDGPAQACRGCGAPATCSAGARLLARSGPLPLGVSLHATASSLLWHPAAGTVTPTATFRLGLLGKADSTVGIEVQHVVNLLGRSRSCSNDARVRFHAPC